jgi:hypothetical protein
VGSEGCHGGGTGAQMAERAGHGATLRHGRCLCVRAKATSREEEDEGSEKRRNGVKRTTVVAAGRRRTLVVAVVAAVGVTAAPNQARQPVHGR